MSRKIGIKISHPGKIQSAKLSSAMGFLLFLFLLSCAQKPTRIFDSQDYDTLQLSKALNQPISITVETVVIDVREPFDFAMAHLPRAVNMSWLDFSERGSATSGRLKKDLSEIARRLSLIGVHPKSSVVILGKGLKGNGEEARMAWCLLYLGIQDVQIAEADSLGLRYSNIETPPTPNAQRWEPTRVDSLDMTRSEFLEIATTKRDAHTYILDVRSQSEYFSKNRFLEYEVPDLHALNIEWKEFFNKNGRPNFAIIKKLKEINIDRNDRVIVVSNNGLRSGAVTYALLSLGFKKAVNYSGGYSELLRNKK